MTAYRKRRNKLPPFVPILREMLKSAAWEKISNSSKVAYIHLKSKCVYNNPGELTLSYSEMERVMERRTFARALRELETLGFITRTKRGGLFRQRNFFRLSEERRKQSSSGNGAT